VSEHSASRFRRVITTQRSALSGRLMWVQVLICSATHGQLGAAVLRATGIAGEHRPPKTAQAMLFTYRRRMWAACAGRRPLPSGSCGLGAERPSRCRARHIREKFMTRRSRCYPVDLRRRLGPSRQRVGPSLGSWVRFLRLLLADFSL